MSGNVTPRDGGAPRTPPSSARRPSSARFSSRSHPFAASLAAKTPRTPRIVGEPLHVLVRIKPPNDRRDAIRVHVVDHTQLMLEGVASGGLDPSSPAEEIRRYEFGSVFPPDTPDETIHNDVCPRVLEQLRQGFNSTVLCYGQTGSGKTYTINSILPKLVEQVFLSLEAVANSEGVTHIVEMSFTQIYNSSVYNLLEGRGDMGEPLPKPMGLLVPEPLVVVSSAEEALAKWGEAQKRRVTSAHQMNQKSSRSHCLFSLHIAKCLNGTPIQGSKVTIVDLAGSERLKKTLVEGSMNQEAIQINKSLLALGRAIEALSEGKQPVYRESVLTLYLAQSLNDACNIIIACIACDSVNYGETKNTLEFATVAKKCVVTRSKMFDKLAARGGDLSAVCGQLQREITALRNQLELLQQETDLERERNRLLRERICLHAEVPNNHGTSADAAGPRSVPPLAASGLNPVGLDAVSKRIMFLEEQSASFSDLVREKELELRQLETKRSDAETMATEFAERQKEKEQTRSLLADICTSPDTPAALKEKLSALNEIFLWQENAYRVAVETARVLETNVEQLQDALKQSTSELHESHVNSLKWEQALGSARDQISELSQEKNRLMQQFDDLDLKYQREKNEHAMEIRTLQLDKKNNAARRTDLEKMQKAIADQSSLLSAMEARLKQQEMDLVEALQEKAKAEERATIADQAYRNYEKRQSTTAAGRGRIGPFTGSEPLPPGSNPYEILSLKKTISAELAEKTMLREQLQSREFQIMELTNQIEAMNKELQSKDQECRALEQLELAHSLKGEQFEKRLDEVYTELEANINVREALEKQLDNKTRELQQSEDEYRASMIEIEKLQTQLEEMVSRLKKFESNNDELSARLREKEEEALSAKREIDLEHQRVKDLEQALRERNLESAELMLKLKSGRQDHANLKTLVANRRRHENHILGRLGDVAPERKTAARHQQAVARLQRETSTNPSIDEDDESVTELVAERLNAQNRSRKISLELSGLVRAIPAAGFTEGANVFHQYHPAGVGTTNGSAGTPLAPPAAVYRDPNQQQHTRTGSVNNPNAGPAAAVGQAERGQGTPRSMESSTSGMLLPKERDNAPTALATSNGKRTTFSRGGVSPNSRPVGYLRPTAAQRAVAVREEESKKKDDIKLSRAVPPIPVNLAMRK